MTEKYKLINGLALDEVKKLPDQSVNCVVTSPPYWQLRNYGFADQWGLEKVYQEYLNNLWLLMDELWRVLADDGTVWVNLGIHTLTVAGKATSISRRRRLEISLHIRQRGKDLKVCL